jgi:ArsR family transcriptional regulator
MKTTARIFKALSETIRLRILALLIEGERCVCDLMAVLNLPQSTVSRHLATLRTSGWIKGRRQGLWMYYRLAETDNPVQQLTLELLRRELVALHQGKTDQEALNAYLATKTEATCHNWAVSNLQ